MSNLRPLHILSDRHRAGIEDPEWPLADLSTDALGERRVYTHEVTFATPFEDAAPVVQVSLCGFDADNRAATRLSLRPHAITTRGFSVVIETWRDSRVYGVEFSWLAIGT